ncbi:MAG TPA: chemotaxis protein CheW [Bdellovibrionales bacterium]|jgi:purine-binding chemotaxis protein CheW|nr:chemotaxis protein CheW [Bdellovibrionales bacterium]
MESSNPKQAAVSSIRHLCFSLGEEEYAVPLAHVREVIELPEVTPMPHSPAHYRGIMNLRGQILSIIDLRLKIKGSKQEASNTSAVIILDFESFFVGVVVSSVNRVVPFEVDEIKEPPRLENSHKLDYIGGVVQRDKKLILVLDVAKALNVEDLRAIQTHSTVKAA